MSTATATISNAASDAKSSIGKVLSNPLTMILALLVALFTAHTVYQIERKKKTFKQVINDDLKLLASPTAIVSILGFVTGVCEAIIFQNLKVHGLSAGLKSGKLFEIPNKDEFKQTLIVLIITSILTGLLTDLTIRMLNKEKAVAVAPAKKTDKKA